MSVEQVLLGGRSGESDWQVGEAGSVSRSYLSDLGLIIRLFGL